MTESFDLDGPIRRVADENRDIAHPDEIAAIAAQRPPGWSWKREGIRELFANDRAALSDREREALAGRNRALADRTRDDLLRLVAQSTDASRQNRATRDC